MSPTHLDGPINFESMNRAFDEWAAGQIVAADEDSQFFKEIEKRPINSTPEDDYNPTQETHISPIMASRMKGFHDVEIASPGIFEDEDSCAAVVVEEEVGTFDTLKQYWSDKCEQ